MDWVRVAAVAGLVVLLLAVGLAYVLGRWTVYGETDPYQRPQRRPDDQGRDTWRSSR